MAESLINPKDLLARTGVDGGDGGGGINPQCIRIAAGDTPHDFKPGRTANNTSAKADDELAEAGEDISADQEELVLAVAGLAVYFASKGIDNVDSSRPTPLPNWEKDSDVPGMEYLQGALSTLTNSTISSVSDYERRMEKYILKDDAVSNAFGAVTTVYIQDILSSWEKWNAIPNDGNKPERPQFWCDICGKSTDAVSKALINKTIDLKWNPSDDTYDPNKVYKSKGKAADEKYLRVLANFMLTYMHPEDNAGSMKAVFVFDMGSGSVGKTLTVLPQVKNALIPQVVSDSACTNMKQLDKGRNMLWFPTTNPAQSEYEYQANIFTYPLGIRFVMNVSAGGPADYNNKDDSVADNFKITIQFGQGLPAANGSLRAIAKSIFGANGDNQVVLDFRENASNVGPSVAYLASLIYAIRNNMDTNMGQIPADLRDTNPTSSNMINISEQFAQLANNINRSPQLQPREKQQAFAILCFMLFDIKRSGDWEQARACFYIPEDVVGKPMFCTGDILCGVFARLIGANSIWRSPKGNVKDWNFRIHRKVNKALDPAVASAIKSVQNCTEIIKILGFTAGLGGLETDLRVIMTVAEEAAKKGLFIQNKSSEESVKIRTQQIITYLARIRALDIHSHAKTILDTIGGVTNLYARSFPAPRKDASGAIERLSENEIEEIFIEPLKILINLFYATGNPQPENAASFQKKRAIQTYKQLFDDDERTSKDAITKFKSGPGGDMRIQMKVENPFLEIRTVNRNGAVEEVPIRQEISTNDCMSKVEKLVQYEEAMQVFFRGEGDVAQAAQFGSIAKALSRLSTNVKDPNIPFSELKDTVSNYGIRVKSIEKIKPRADGTSYYMTTTEYDLGNKGGQLLRRDNTFNAGFQSASFGYSGSDLQRLGSAIIQQFLGLTSASGIRFKTSADNYVGSDGMNNLGQYENIMDNRMANLDLITTLDKQLSQAQGGDAAAVNAALQDAKNKRIQIAPPANTDDANEMNNDNKTQRLFCNSSNPGSWLSMTEEKGKRGSEYKLAVNDCLTFKNNAAASMIGTGMGYLSGFMRNSILALDKAKAKFLAAPARDGLDAFRVELFDHERLVQIALSKQNAVSTAGFRLFNMGESEWNTLLPRGYKAKDTPRDSVLLVLKSKATLAIWFHSLFKLSTGQPDGRSIVQQYLVRQPALPADLDLMNAISRLAGPPAAGVDDPKLPWQNLATTLRSADNPFAIGWNWLGYIQGGVGAPAPVVDYQPFVGAAPDLAGYHDLIKDVTMVLDKYKGCLPMTYLVMALYARQMDRIFQGAKDALKNGNLTCGFIVSEAVEQCALSTGLTKENITIDDIVFAAMQLVMYGLNAKIPDANAFPQSGGGHNDILQFGGSNYATIGDPLATSTQNELIQDLYLKVIGIAQGAISSLFSTKVTITPAWSAALGAMIAAQAPLGAPQVTEVTIGTGPVNLIGFITQYFRARGQGLTPIDVFEKLMIALTVASRTDAVPLSADGFDIRQFVDTVQLNKIAQAMYAYGDEIQRVWSNGMQDVTDNASFQYTPTYTDLVLSTAFSYSGNKSGETAPDSTYLHGIYYNGPLLNVPDAGNYLGANTALVNPNPALPGCNVMTGLPSLFSLYVYTKEIRNIPEVFDIRLFNAASNDAYYKQLFVDFSGWVAQNQSIAKLATSNGNPAGIDPDPTSPIQFRPSIVLYQLIKICSLNLPNGGSRGPPPLRVYPDVARKQRQQGQTRELLALLNRFSAYFMEDGGQGQGIISSMASIPQAAAAVTPTPSDNFIAPVLKNIQALSLVGTLITPPRDTQIAEATENVNEILLSNQLIGRRSEMFAAVTQAASTAPATPAAAAVINNLVDMINQMNGYSLIDPDTKEYFPEGRVDPRHLMSQYIGIDPSTGTQIALKPIPPLEYLGTTHFDGQRLAPDAWLPYALSVIAGNADEASYQSDFVTKQINEDYDARGLSKGFTESTLANIAFNVATTTSQTLADLAYNTYFNTPWVTTNPESNQYRMLILYRYILNNYPDTGQRGDQIRDLLPALGGVLFGGASKNRTRKHRKKHNKTRREKKNIGNKTRGRDKHKKKRHTRKSD